MRRIGSEEPLLLQEAADAKRVSWRDSVVVRTSAFGLNGLFFAAHLVLNGKLLSSLDDENGSAASSLMSTYQSVVIGSSVGFLLGTGLDFGTADGKREYATAGNVAKTAMVLATVLGVSSAVAMLITKSLFPLFFNAGASKIASDFFTGYSVGTIPLLYLIVGPQVAFQIGDWFIPPLTMFSVFSMGGIMSYLLGFPGKLGALGVGLGGSIGSLLTLSALGVWFSQKRYSRYQFYSRDRIEDFLPKMKSLLQIGWKLAFQRLTEWGNLFIITTIVGIRNNDALTALNPGLLYLILFGTAEQGFAQAAGMIIIKNKGMITKAITEQKYNEVKGHHEGNIRTVVRSNLFGALANTVVFASFYAARKPLTQFFLSSTDDEQLSENLFTASMIGLIPDALRIIGAGALRGWRDLLYPTLVSFIMMTIAGISVGYGAESLTDEDDGELMLYIRDLSMLLSAVLILKRCYSQIQADRQALEPHLLVEAGLFQVTNPENRQTAMQESKCLAM